MNHGVGGRLGEGLTESLRVRHVCLELYGTGTEGAVLVRPDGFIAWRAREATQNGGSELSAALGQILGR